MDRETLIIIGCVAAAVIYKNKTSLNSAIKEVYGMAKDWDNNYLNIRGTYEDGTMWDGEKKSFRNKKNYLGFVDPKYCFRAGFKLLRNYSAWHGVNTIDSIITRWAPASDNNHTQNYINYISDKMNYPSWLPVLEFQYAEMLAYMSEFETGLHGKFTPEMVEKMLEEFGLV